MKKIAVVFFFLSALEPIFTNAQTYRVSSPDKKTTLTIRTKGKLTYSISFNRQTVVAPSALSMTVNSRTLGKDPVVVNTSRRSVNQIIKPLYGKFKKIADRYNELRIGFRQPYSLVCRVYNEGVAYRFETRFTGNITVDSEAFNLALNGRYKAVYPETTTLTSWELSYKSYPSTDSIANGTQAILPTLFTRYSDSLRVIVAEADLRDYPGMYIRKSGDRFCGYWAHYPEKTTPYGGAWGMSTSVDSRENDLAHTGGSRTFPWRVVMLCNDDKKLLANTLIYQLAAPCAIRDTSWIRPGKCAWEWWHDAIDEDAPFPTGLQHRDTRLYKYYIDFAAENKLDYLLIDAGWSNFYHLDTPARQVDIKELIKYGQAKHIGIMVWCNATSLLSNLDHDLDTFAAWGLKGIKVDFFDRDDQLIMDQLEEIAAKAAKRHLLVDFHGCPKPTGLERTYPNIINFEAVRGEECSKWDYTSNPAYHLQTAFIRMLGGPLDCTPGCMRNRSKDAFKPIPKGLPTTQGTRCHELSMFVLYDQYLAVLCDSPDAYRKYKDVLTFLSYVPVTWDDTRILAAQLGQYAVVAKQKGSEWYVGAMTDWNSRNITIDFSFLPGNGPYKAEIFKDGPDADTNAMSYTHEEITVNRHSKLTIRLASGGGAVMRVYR